MLHGDISNIRADTYLIDSRCLVEEVDNYRRKLSRLCHFLHLDKLGVCPDLVYKFKDGSLDLLWRKRHHNLEVFSFGILPFTDRLDCLLFQHVKVHHFIGRNDFREYMRLNPNVVKAYMYGMSEVDFDRVVLFKNFPKKG